MGDEYHEKVEFLGFVEITVCEEIQCHMLKM